MRWLTVNQDYRPFTEWLYQAHPGLADQPYEQQLATRVATRFGTADFFSHALRAAGHDATDIFVNNETMQRRWAAEHGLRVTAATRRGIRWRKGVVPWPYTTPSQSWMREILAAQIADYQPDVLLSMAPANVNYSLLRHVRDHYRLAVAIHASMIPPVDMRGYDLYLSSLPNLVDHFRAHGLPAAPLKWCFDPRILGDLNGTGQQYDLVFIGGLSGVQHEPGARMLEEICRHLDVQIWGYGIEGLPESSPLRARFRGPVWGTAMFQTLRAARMVLNRHGPIALNYANNLRLYEATGVGALLLTEAGQNLGEIFEPGREVVTYQDVGECIEKAVHFLSHEDERASVAAAGHRRVLRDHTYAQRVQELIALVEERL